MRSPCIDTAFVKFLARACDLKSLVDHGTDPAMEISVDAAASTIDTAERFIVRITSPVGWFERAATSGRRPV